VKVELIDGVLAPRLFARLLKGVRAVGETRLRSTYQTSFWHPHGETPASVVDEAVEAIWDRVAPRGATGAEWWLSRMRTSNVQVDFHRDRDERLALKTGREVHPTLSSVLFLNRCVGGLLAVTEEDPDPREPACAPRVHDFQLVEPRPNRLAIFPGDATHGVLDAENQIPLRALPKQPALRLSIPINFWKSPPAQIRTFRERRVYKPLRTLR
jgi:hypothetical protein